MLETLLGGAISAGAGLIGGKMEADAAAKNNRLQMIQAAENRELQKQFAKEGIQWRVADARAAGIHPLAALGAQTASFSPITLGTTPESGMGSALASAGQDIGRAVAATSTQGQRLTAAAATMQKLQLDNASLQNDLLRTQIARNAAQIGPPMPSLHSSARLPGQGNTDTGRIDLQPAPVTTSMPGRPDIEAGTNPTVSYLRGSAGTFVATPSAELKNRIDDDMIGTFQHYIRNGMFPPAPPMSPGPNNHWKYNPFTGEFFPRSNSHHEKTFGRNPGPWESYPH